jgi:hypothetical protein
MTNDLTSIHLELRDVWVISSENTCHTIDGDKKSISLGNLLSMTPGIACEDTTVSPELDQTGDWVQYFLTRPMSSKPGTKMFYRSMNGYLSQMPRNALPNDCASYLHLSNSLKYRLEIHRYLCLICIADN